MVTPPSPRVALLRWLAQIHYNAIRNIESVIEHVTTTDHRGPLRGFKIADDLVLTRKRVFYKLSGAHAIPQSIEEVAANYNLDVLRSRYRKATETWKNIQRNKRRIP